MLWKEQEKCKSLIRSGLFLMVLFTFSLPGHSEWRKILDLEEVHQKIIELKREGICKEEEILAVFDIDDTLFTPNKEEIQLIQQLDQLTRLKKNDKNCEIEIIPELETEHQLLYNRRAFDEDGSILGGRFGKILSVHRNRLTQENLLAIMDRIQAQVPMMALTARYGIYQDLTEGQLRHLGIDFSRNKHFLSLPELAEGDFVKLRLTPPATGIDLDLRVHKHLLELDENGTIKGYKFSFQRPWTEQMAKELNRNKGTEYILLPPELSLGPAALLDRPKDKIVFSFLPETPPGSAGNQNYHPITYRRGVISSSNLDKGVVLRTFLQSSELAGRKYKCILFVDDDGGRIQQVESALAMSPGVKSYSFWYRRMAEGLR